jgi:hypothetical protein
MTQLCQKLYLNKCLAFSDFAPLTMTVFIFQADNAAFEEEADIQKTVFIILETVCSVT